MASKMVNHLVVLKVGYMATYLVENRAVEMVDETVVKRVNGVVASKDF